MKTYIHKLIINITLLVFASQFFWGPSLYAVDLVCLCNSLICHNETEGDILRHPVHRGIDGYHLNFDESLRGLTKPLRLYDNDTQEYIGVITKTENVFQVVLNNISTRVSQLLGGVTMQFFQHKTAVTPDIPILNFDAPIISDLYANTRRVVFSSSVHTDKDIKIDADELKTQDMTAARILFAIKEFTNTHTLKAKSIQMYAGLGINRSKILSESNLLLGGDWANEAIIAALGDVEVTGGIFYNREGASVTAGNKFVSSSRSYEDEGRLTIAGTGEVQGHFTRFGETFNFLGQGLKIDTLEFDSELQGDGGTSFEDENIGRGLEDDLTGKIVVRDYFYLNAKKITHGQGRIFKEAAMGSHAAYDILKDLFGPIKRPTFTSTIVETCVGIRCDGEVTSEFDITVQDNGSVLIEGSYAKIYGKIWHGLDGNSKTIIKGKDKVSIQSSYIGDNVEIIAPIKHIEAIDSEGKEEIKCAKLHLSGGGAEESTTYIDAPMRTLSLFIDDTGRIGLHANILGMEEDLPTVFVKGEEIYAGIPILEAKVLELKAKGKITYKVIDSLTVERGMFESNEYISLIGDNLESFRVLEGLLLKAPHKSSVRLKVDAKESTTEGETLFASGSIRSEVLKSRERDSVFSTADLVVGTLDVVTGRFIQLGDVKAKMVTVDGKDVVKFFADFEAEQVRLHAGAGGTHVSRFLFDSFVSTTAGDTTLGLGITRTLKVEGGGKFIGVDTLEFTEEGTINAALGITAQEIKAAIAKLKSSQGRSYVDKASGGTLDVEGAAFAMVRETRAKNSSVLSSKGDAFVGKAVDIDTLRVKGTNAHAGLEEVKDANVTATNVASATGLVATLHLTGDIANAEKLKAKTLEQVATTYARIDGDLESVKIRAPLTSVTGGSTVGTLNIADNGDVCLSEVGKTLRIGKLTALGKGSIYNRGRTFVKVADVRDGVIINHQMLEFTQATLVLQKLLNFGQMKFRSPSSVKVGSVMHNAGTIAGTGTLDMHLEHQFGMGRINVEALTDLIQQIPLQGRILQFNGAGTEPSETYVEQVMGMEDNQCGFFALDTTREEAVNTLLQNIDNDSIRHIIGQELYRELYRALREENEGIPSEFFVAAAPFLIDIEETQQEIAAKEALIEELKEESAEGEEITEVLEALRVMEEETNQALLKLERANQTLKEWCYDKDVFKAYVQEVIGRAGNPLSGTQGHMLEVERDFGTTPLGTMDAIAALQGYALEVYTIDTYHADGTPILTRIYTFNPIEHGFEGDFKTRRVVITSTDVKSNPTALNHYNVLRTQEEANNWRVRLVNSEDQSGTLCLRVQTTRVPERLISDANITAADTLQWFFQGYQPFCNRVPVPQKSSVHVDGKATIYNGFDAKADFSLTADEINIRRSDIASVGTLHLKATKGDVDVDHARIESKKDATISAAGSAVLHATAVKAEGDITLEAIVDTFLESMSRRIGNGDNYHDVKEATTLTAGDTLKITAGRHNIHKASETYSDKATILEAVGKVIDLPLALERHTYHTFKGGFSRDKYVHQAVSTHGSAGVILSTAQDTQELYAPSLRASAVRIAGKNGVNSYAVYDTHESQYCKKTRGGVFGGRETTSSNSSSAYGKGAKLEATEHVKLSTDEGDVILTAINVHAPHTVVEALKGGVKFRSATNTSASSTFNTRSNIAWQSYSTASESHRTYTPAKFSGTVDVHAKEIIIEAVHAETIDLIQRLNAHGADLRTNILHEVHTLEKKSGGGPTPALAAVVALAVSIYTGGAGIALGDGLAAKMGMVTASAATTSSTAVAAAGAGAVATSAATTATALTTAGAVVSGMTAGAFTSVCTQAGMALLSAEGDIGKAARSLLTADAFKAIMTAAVTASITRGVTDHYGMALSGKMSLLGHGKAAGLNAGAGIIGNMAIGGKSLSRSLEPAFVSAVVSAFTAFGANKISEAYSGASDAVKLDYITHKITHALLGAAAGAVLSNDDPAAGAAAGATGAVVAEVVCEMIRSPQLTIAMDGPRLTEEEFKAQHQERFDAYGRDVSNAATIARLSAATTAMLTRQDVDMANFTASNAINNNFFVLAYYGVLTASAAWTAYDVHHTFETEGLEPALKKLGINLAAMAVGGAVGKFGGKIIAAQLAAHFEANPLLKVLLGNMVDKMLTAAAKLEGTAIGKMVAKAEGALLAGKDKASKVASGVKSKLTGGEPVANAGAGTAQQSWGKSIYEQGINYEDAVARTLPARARLPRNFRTFDFYDDTTGLAISVKTLNTTTPAKIANPKQIYYSLKSNIDAVASFAKAELLGVSLTAEKIIRRELHVAIPHGATPAQWIEINKAIDYAKINNVIVKMVQR